jgi:outer membrane protein with beta-barrel domain
MRILFAAIALIIGASAAYPADVFTNGGSIKDVPEVAASNPFAGFYAGVDVGGSFTDIAITVPGYKEFADGISNDGLTFGGHAGYNACFGRVCVGPYFDGGWTDGKTTFANVDVLKFENYMQPGVQAGVLAGKSTFVFVGVGYEWQGWEASNGADSVDVDVEAISYNAGIETMIAPMVSFGVKVDYLDIRKVEVGSGVGDISDYLDDSEQIRVRARLTFRPSQGIQSLTSVLDR